MLMRFDPFGDFDRLTRSLWGEMRSTYMPADAYRKDDRFYLHIDLPGVDPESIDLTVEKDTLTVHAERNWDRGDDEQVILAERPMGTFTRQFFLGESLDTDKIEAGYDHGVLTITIPVAETARPRKIDVGTVHEALSS
jgi:HSP20 family protein